METFTLSKTNPSKTIEIDKPCNTAIITTNAINSVSFLCEYTTYGTTNILPFNQLSNEPKVSEVKNVFLGLNLKITLGNDCLDDEIIFKINYSSNN